MIDIINDINYFNELPEYEIKVLAEGARIIRADAEETLFVEGDPAAGLYYVVRGRIKIVRYSPEGRQLIVREFFPGETFNEVGALDATTNPASAVTDRKETEVALIPGELIRKLADRYPGLSTKMMNEMAKKLRFAMARVNNLALMDVKARLALKLLESMDESGLLLGLSHEELAAQLGTVRQVLGRALGELREAGIVEVRRGSIKVIDRDALEVIVDG